MRSISLGPSVHFHIKSIFLHRKRDNPLDMATDVPNTTLVASNLMNKHASRGDDPMYLMMSAVPSQMIVILIARGQL